MGGLYDIVYHHYYAAEHIAVNMDGEDDDIEQVDTGRTEGDEESSTRSDDINIEERKAKLEEALDVSVLYKHQRETQLSLSIILYR